MGLHTNSEGLHTRPTAGTATWMATVPAFVAAHADAEQLESGKVLCKTTGHEVLPQLDLLQAHWAGKTYKKKVRALP